MLASLLSLAITLAVAAIIVALILWVLRQVPLPEPIGQIVRIAVIVIACIVVIMALLDFAGMGTGIRLPDGD